MKADEISAIVAIDGPAGAGKSTIAKRVAKTLGFEYLDTGAMYRAATWWAMQQGVNLNDEDALVESTRRMPFRFQKAGETLRVWVGNEDVSEAIRTPEITANISRIDNCPGVREQLVRLQREIGAMAPTVAEGRDIGTVVFPSARCKIYLDAAVEIRADRRRREFAQKGIDVDKEKLERDIRGRDERDMMREHSPLRRADGARVIDTSNLTPDEAVDAIVAVVKEVW